MNDLQKNLDRSEEDSSGNPCLDDLRKKHQQNRLDKITNDRNPSAVKEIKEILKSLDFKISDVVRERIKKKNAKYFCNDNISEFLMEGETELLIEEVSGHVQNMLESLVIDTENDHNTRDTAHRVAKMFVNEIFAGRFQPAPKVTAFPNVGYKGLYTTGPISIRSVCAHHLQNIVGKCWIGVVPEDEVIGLSKFNRIVHHIAQRPQIQEEMTTQIAEALKEFTKSKNIAVVLKAEHHCMLSRGVKEHESEMVTTYLGGSFETNGDLRSEFYSIIQNLGSY